MQHTVNDEVKMFAGTCTINQISHSNPLTEVKLIVDGDVVHTSSKASITSFTSHGDMFDGIYVHEWFKVEAPDAHVIIYVEKEKE